MIGMYLKFFAITRQLLSLRVLCTFSKKKKKKKREFCVAPKGKKKNYNLFGGVTILIKFFFSLSFPRFNLLPFSLSLTLSPSLELLPPSWHM